MGALDDTGGLDTLNFIISQGLALRFPLYGLAFGFLFPLLRGRTGIDKAWRLLVVLVVTEAFIILPFTWSTETQTVIILRMIQLLVVVLVLGFAFDWRSLRTAGFGFDRLGDVYNVNRITVVGSGILLTAATALGTTVFASGFDALVNILTPPVDAQEQQQGQGQEEE
jgi:hypothetical protein